MFIHFVFRGCGSTRIAMYGPIRTLLSQGQQATAYLCKLQ